MSNAGGIPIQQQHGQLDDNVPAYNSRLLAQQLFLSGANSSYNEVPGQNHWWETVMTTPQLVSFYYTQTKGDEILPRSLDEFEIVIGDPGDMGSKGGIKVLLLEDPGQYGRVHVDGHITTSNVLSLEFELTVFKSQAVTIDNDIVGLGEASGKRGAGTVTISRQNGVWRPGLLDESNSILYRRGRQLGSNTAILRTQGAFIIRHQGLNTTSHIALQVSRNLHQYFQADTEVIPSISQNGTGIGTGNVITIALSNHLPSSLHPDFPIQPNSSGVVVRDSRGRQRQYSSDDTSLGATFLQPLEEERLELVLWGSDAEGLAQAARLVPMLTGVGQPDFVVLGESAKWKGVDGALAMGFFDHKWEITPSSVVS